jgi:hypothetical protein
MEGTAGTKLKFRGCDFSAGEFSAIIADGLASNTSVACFDILSPCDGTLYKALALALPSNSTIRDISFLYSPISAQQLEPIFLALARNTGVKTLKVYGVGFMKESLCTALKHGLGMNETLVSLKLNDSYMCDDNAELWCEALSFLRTNKTLKSLMVDVLHTVKESCLSAFRVEVVAMLQENVSLESLSIQGDMSPYKTKAEDYVALIPALQHNTTLKTLRLNFDWLRLTDDEDKHMAKILKKNYALESLPQIYLEFEARDVGAILRLNAAGRRYLIEDGFSVSRGVEVLSAVRSDINCVFSHLLENPNLCDRSAVEAASESTDDCGSGSPVNNIGEREHGRAQTEGKESRRRIT